MFAQVQQRTVRYGSTLVKKLATVLCRPRKTAITFVNGLTIIRGAYTIDNRQASSSQEELRAIATARSVPL